MSTGSILFILFLGTLLLPFLYGIIAWRNVDPVYRPMLIFIWVIFGLQIIESFVPFPHSVKNAFHNAEPLIEWLLVAWQAKRLRIFEKRPGLFWMMLNVLLLARIAEKVLWNSLPGDFLWFSAAISFMITLLAIEMLSRTMISTTINGPLLSNPIILFSVALIFYYTFSGLLDVFMIIGRYSGMGVIHKAFYFYMVLGIFTNIIYLRSFLCIPTKTNYSIS